MSLTDTIHFKLMSLVHETLYGLFRDPHSALTAAGLQSGQKVLEVGCGPGFFTLPAAEIVGPNGSICAIDVSPAAVQHVRNKIARAGAANIEVRLADAAQTHLAGSSFDLAFVFGFHHAGGNLNRIYAELHRLLKPDGALAVEGALQPPDDLFAPLEQAGDISRFRRIS